MMLQHRKHSFDFSLQSSYDKGLGNVIYRTYFITSYLVAFLIVRSQKNHDSIRVFWLNQLA